MSDSNTNSGSYNPVVPAALGFVLGLCIVGFFFLLAVTLGLATFVVTSDVPMQ